MKNPLIVIAGPTACGKTSTSIALAKKIGGEIISADSMQVYRYMDIGTAKITREEMQGIHHYLIDEFLPDEEFNVMVFQQKAKQYMEEIWEKGKIPILVGGTGFYINALVYDNNFMETNENTELRNRLYEEAKTFGPAYIHNKLREVDPASADKIHYNNVKRVARAIEYYELTGERISEHNRREKEKESPYNTAFIILNMDRKLLYDRINSRVDKMIENGLVEEVQKLLCMGYSPSLVSMQGLGYKEIVSCLEGECTLSEAAELLKKSTRHFAKRQLTWFRGQSEGLWMDITKAKEDEILDKILSYCRERNIHLRENIRNDN